MSKPSYAIGPETPLVEMTLAEALARTAQRYPGREAVVSRHQNLRYTWREFDDAEWPAGWPGSRCSRRIA
jgi:fatty-acyl-CoA synthase